MVAVRANQERTVGHYKATWCYGFHIFSAISLRFVKMFKIQERIAVAGKSPVGVTGVLKARS